MNFRNSRLAAWKLTLALMLSAILAAGSVACRNEDRAEQEVNEPEVISLLGKPLFRTPAEGEALAKLEAGLREAGARLEASPDDPEAIIAYGRALSGLWRYHEAIAIYTRGIEAYPDYAMLYRHRGHRYISTRQFDKAVADLGRAAELNDRDFDIWYHLGLAYYLRGEFDQAEPAYLRCLEVSKDDGSIIAVSNWLYLTLRRQGKEEAARKILDRIKEGMEAGENIAYYKLLLFDKGLKSEEELEKAAAESDLDMATIGYGLACRLLIRGEREKAFEMFRKIVTLPYWPAFGYIAAEVELARAQAQNR
ncbi:MAG: tetratricopeptide repeat protein [Candidatus Saccharicenans sp.]|jgi:tetratricopeptide (TPR) repeat protein|nr:tetratricopeptide repeat protein [Candidatus Saccharicenans sp.]MDH7576156.1 tetratricopeptide repeat protein [Candidatus Saccharicenans sp.]